jgi:hypothetical protein
MILIAWRKVLEQRKLATATARRKLSALSDLHNYFGIDREGVPAAGVDKSLRRPDYAVRCHPPSAFSRRPLARICRKIAFTFARSPVAG